MESVEVIVVGAGVAGLSTAWRLAASGHEVVLLERFALGHDRGSSHGATRIFRFAYDDPTYVSLAQAALPLWRELESASGQELLRITGGLDIGPRGELERIASALSSRGAQHEWLDAGETGKRFPWLAVTEEEALFSPDTGVIAAARTLEALATAARQGGADVRERQAVSRLELHGAGISVFTPDHELRARRCVVAAGAWGPALLAPLGVRIPARVTREQVLYFRSPEPVVPFIDRTEPARYVVPAFAGAAGVKVAEHFAGEETSADGRSFEMDPESAARVAAYVADRLPGFDPEPVAFETCLYTTTPDEGFVLDVAGPVVVASPCSGHGFKFGPIVGETLAHLATGREPPVPMGPFAINRFGR
jgi:sarcosine oxidase